MDDCLKLIESYEKNTINVMMIVEDTIILNIFQVIASLCYVVVPDQRQAIT